MFSDLMAGESCIYKILGSKLREKNKEEEEEEEEEECC